MNTGACAVGALQYIMNMFRIHKTNLCTIRSHYDVSKHALLANDLITSQAPCSRPLGLFSTRSRIEQGRGPD